MYARLIAASLATALVAMSAGSAFAEMKTKKLKASREQVREACEKNPDNIGYGTHAKKGGYGCVTDNGFIDCKENGDCVGGTVERVATSRLPKMGSAGKLARR